MAITIVSEPDTEQAGNFIVYQVTQDAPAAGIRRQLKYQLRDAFDNEVTPWESFTDVDGETIRLDFTDIVRSKLEAYTPNLNSITKFNMLDNSTFRFKLVTQEIDFDTSDCSTTEQPETVGAEKEAYNAFFMPWQAEQALADGEYVFSEKPRNIEMVRGQNDWLFFFTGSPGPLFVVVQEDIFGNALSVHAETLPTNRYYAIGISGNNTEGINLPLEQLGAIRIRLGQVTYEIEFTKEPVNNCPGLEFREMYFFEPMGTLSSIMFDEVSISGSRSFTTARPLDIPEQDASNYRRIESFGERIVTNNSGPSFTVTKNISDQEEMSRFYNGFASANLHFTKMLGDDGDWYMARVMLVNCGEYRGQDGGAVLQATYRFHRPLTSPYRTNFD